MLNRRQMLGALVGSAGTFASGSALARFCGLTPKQTQGPFYPTPAQQKQPDTNTDLTQVDWHTEKAKGEVVLIAGTVQDQNCERVPGALVEIWQACHSGKYNHPNDPNPAELDPNFQYWGRAVSNERGEYSFKTIIPGAYPAGEDWIRPPHVHFKVAKTGCQELITQMYFAGEPLNDRDLILQEMSEEDQKKVIVKFEAGVGRFDISIRKLAR
jgi:protocatechuate 3,4-dioxygenase, beta subunit